MLVGATLRIPVVEDRSDHARIVLCQPMARRHGVLTRSAAGSKDQNHARSGLAQDAGIRQIQYRRRIDQDEIERFFGRSNNCASRGEYSRLEALTTPGPLGRVQRFGMLVSRVRPSKG